MIRSWRALLYWIVRTSIISLAFLLADSHRRHARAVFARHRLHEGPEHLGGDVAWQERRPGSRPGTGGPGAMGPRLRRPALDQARHHLRPPVGVGARGVYEQAAARTGPIAQSFTGLSEMSQFTNGHFRPGWGWSYLDWIGAYSFALALVSALSRRTRHGEGQMGGKLAVRGWPVCDGHVDPGLGGERAFLVALPGIGRPTSGRAAWRLPLCWNRPLGRNRLLYRR